MRLRTLLALCFALVAFTVAFCGALVAQHLTNATLDRRIGAETADLATRIRILLDRSMANRLRDVEMLASVARTVVSTPEARRAWIVEMSRSFPAYAWIGFANPEGIVTTALGGRLEGQSVAARPWFREGLKGPVAEDLHEAVLLARELPPAPAGEPRRFVDLAAPVLDAAGRPAGVVAAHLSWSWAREVVASVLGASAAASPDTVAMVIDRKGIVVLGPGGLEGAKLPAEAGIWRSAGAGERFELETWPDGRTYLVGASPTIGDGDYRGLGWTVLVRQGADAALAPAHHLGRRLLFAGIGLAALAGLLGWFIAWRIGRPLVAFTHVADLIGRAPGGLAVPAFPTGTEEVQRLGAALRGMTTAIADRDRILVSSNAELELRVQERTRELEAARIAADDANRAKSRFLAGMSHELRTPLNGLLGYAELLRIEGGLTARQAERVGTMLAAGRHLLGMITRVLDLSEVEADRVELRTDCVRLDRTMRECLDVVRPAAAAKHLVLSLRESASVPPALLTDPTRLRQIVLNLLGNAVKFTPHGEVVLAIAPSGADMVRIAITDTGPGVPAGLRDRLFNAFERLDADAGTEGAGLGLALSMRLAALLGGRLGHDPNPEGGSIFWLDLPRHAPASPDHPPARGAASPDRGALDVLVVDDVAMNRDIALGMLQAAGHVVALAENGAEAVAAAAAADFDVILMDVRMPGMDGLEATRRIRALAGPRGAVPIVALTAQAFLEQVAECRDAGMDDHLVKPFAPADLLVAVPTGGLARAGTPLGRYRSPPSRRGLNLGPVASTSDLPWADTSGGQSGRVGEDGQMMLDGHGVSHQLRSRARVLVVEDDDLQREVLGSALRRSGYETEIVTDGMTAIQRLRAGGFDLALIDYRIPEIDGVNVARLARDLAGSGHRPQLVALTASPDGVRSKERSGAVFDAVVVKGPDIADLLQVVETQIEQSRLRSVPTPAAHAPTRLSFAAFAVAVTLCVGLVAAAFAFRTAETTIAALGSAGENLAQSDDARHSASLVETALRDAEFAQSRYLLSGAQPDHDRFLAAAMGVDQVFASRLMASLDPASGGGLGGVEPIVEARLGDLSQAATLRGTDGLAAALGLLEPEGAKRAADRVTAWAERTAQPAQALAARAVEESRHGIEREVRVGAGAIGCLLFACLLAATLRRRPLRLRTTGAPNNAAAE